MTQPLRIADPTSSADRDLAVLVEELTAKLQAGEPVDVPAYVRQHPEHAERLRQLLPALEVLADFACSAVPSDASGPRTGFDPGPVPGVLGDFRLFREIGRGGMGVVYEAEQLSLRRRVALKVLPFAAALDPKQLQRFKQEAEAAAHLHHTHIVPVHFVGCERGVHFYAMQFIDGQTLAAVISGLRQESEPRPSGSGGAPPLPDGRGSESTALLAALTTERSARSPVHFHTVARLGVQAAEALEHAHQLGVVHRDIKPANLLVDGRGHLWVTDFGLARFQSEAGLTLSGDLLGTLRYMSPEQALAKHALVDHRTDVYALGATLYELLTLHPACDGRDRQEVLRQIEHEEPQPPRRLNPAVPADLETIVLKALAKEPEARYGTAQELADDLRRFLEDKPIRARRPTLWQRLKKWARRHRPVVASLVAGGVALLLTVAVTATVAAVRIAGERERTRAEQDRTRDALEDFQRLAAELALDKGQLFGERGDTNLALLWMARSLQLAPAEAQDLQAVIRANLGAWRGRINPLRMILPHGDRDEDQVRAVAFDPDGESFLTGTWRTLQRWDAATGKPIGQPVDYYLKGAKRVATFSPDSGTLLVGYQDGRIRLIDTDSGELREFRDLKYMVTSATFSPDSKTVLIGSADTDSLSWTQSGQAQLYDVATWKPIGPPLKHDRLVWAAAFHPDGKSFVTESGIWIDTTEKTVARFWSLDGKEIRSPLEQPCMAMDVAYSPDGKQFLTGHSDFKARLWDAGTNEPALRELTHEAPVRVVRFGPDARTLLTGSYDGTVRLWDRVTGRPLSPPLWHQSLVQGAVFRPGGKQLLTGASDKTARLWDIAGSPTAPSPWPLDASFCPLAISPDGEAVLTREADHTVQIHEAFTGKPIGEPLRHKGPVTAGAFHLGRRTAVTIVADSICQLWDLATGRPKGDPLPHREGRQSDKLYPDRVYAAAFSPDGRTLLTGSWGMARLWDVTTGTEIRMLQHEPRGPVFAVAFSPDGKTLLSGGVDGTARLWDAATGQPIPKLTHSNLVLAVAFSPDGKTILTGGGDQTARLWDAASGRPAGPPLAHQGGVNAVAFSRDGKTILTGSRDHTARLWDVATGKPLGPPLRHPGPVQGVAFWADGKTLVTAGNDRVARFWPIPTPVNGPAGELELWAQVVTGMELEADGARMLDAATWEKRRQELEGKPIARGP